MDLAITVGPNSVVDLDYSFIINNGGDGAGARLGQLKFRSTTR